MSGCKDTPTEFFTKIKCFGLAKKGIFGNFADYEFKKIPYAHSRRRTYSRNV